MIRTEDILSMEYLNMDLYANVPIGPDIFKAPGAGHNFVHGGASLEECIVPLLEVKAGKGAKNQRTVELQLISTKNKITKNPIIIAPKLFSITYLQQIQIIACIQTLYKD